MHWEVRDRTLKNRQMGRRTFFTYLATLREVVTDPLKPV